MVRGPTNEPIRVLLVDDHDLFRAGLRHLLELEQLDVADCSSGEAALRRITSFPADVVLMDMNMPRMSGIEATRLLGERASGPSVLMLTGTSDEASVVEALTAGASGYLVKDADLGDIVAAIRATAAGHSAIAPRVAGGLVARLRESAAIPQPPPRPSGPAISDRERQVLELVARGLDNGDIARRLFVSRSTVKTHVSRLLQKVGAENRVQIAIYAIRHGLVEHETPSR